MRGSVLSVSSVKSFIMEGVNLLYVAGLARRVILVRIIGEVRECVSIAARRAASGLAIPFLIFGEVQNPTPLVWQFHEGRDRAARVSGAEV